MRFFSTRYLYAGVIALLLGCAAAPQHAQQISPITDIHESLSEVIERHGFSHEIRSQREGHREIDTIFIAIPLDSLKRRHEALDNLMNEIGLTFTRPEYLELPVSVEIVTEEAEDGVYLQTALLPAISKRENIRVTLGADSDNRVIITVGHPR